MADDAKISIDLDPAKILSALNDVAKEVKDLAAKIEQALGKEAPASIKKTEDAAEKGAALISGFFRNMGQRVKEDLKTAFDATGIMQGAKLAKDLGEGAKQVLEMERAFSRLNTRLQLSAKALMDFKTQVGRKVAATGSRLEDVLPGVETVSARGDLKDPKQLAMIAGMLGQAKQITGENVEPVADKIVDILKNQNKKVTAGNFKDTMDAVEGTRIAGAFKSAADAANAIKEITGSIDLKHQKSMGLDTRTVGGLAAVASQSGEGGTDVLNKILQTGQTAGGQQLINSLFGSQVFKNGKISAEGLKGINKNNLGQYSGQVMSEATGVGQAELERFIEQFKNNSKGLEQVTRGANETAVEYELATKNLAAKIDKAKAAVREAGVELLGSASKFANDLLDWKPKELTGDVKDIGSKALQNKGALGGVLGVGALSALWAGGGLNSILRKVPGGGALSGIAGGQIAKMAGATPVYVVNAKDIGGGVLGDVSGIGTAKSAMGFGKTLAANAAILGGSSMAEIGAMGAATIGAAVAGVLAAALAGYGIGKAVNSAFGLTGEKGGDWLYKNVLADRDNAKMQGAENSQLDAATNSYASRHGGAGEFNMVELKEALRTGSREGIEQAHKDRPVQMTNPSSPKGTN